MAVKTVYAIARGDVQGVFFRATTQSFADKLGLAGHVKNLVDGTVEMIVHGEEEKIEELFAYLRSSFHLQESQIEVSSHDLTDIPVSFQINY